jgi:hypothetical protein
MSPSRGVHGDDRTRVIAPTFIRCSKRCTLPEFQQARENIDIFPSQKKRIAFPHDQAAAMSDL